MTSVAAGLLAGVGIQSFVAYVKKKQEQTAVKNRVSIAFEMNTLLS
jgi:hypothetical protein